MIPDEAPCHLSLPGSPRHPGDVDFYEKLGFTALPAGSDPDDDLRILLFDGEL
ncbi:hypothetical protein [Streptomyces sp. NPDC031705]|uniref:hypothetical protein n=1 Tax=Streptomyces sp. NPDC031705 TaxID=3155729 RepID=UPI0033E3FE7A